METPKCLAYFEKFNKISSILLPLFSYEISIEKQFLRRRSQCVLLCLSLRRSNVRILLSYVLVIGLKIQLNLLDQRDYYDNLIYILDVIRCPHQRDLKKSSSQIQHGQTASIAVVTA